MLGRKSSCAGMMSAAVAGVDRSRVGERLQAALAGLQELHLLKDRQSDMVSWALRVDREEPVSSVQAGPEDPNMMGVEEQRLEATLTALKQQLVGHFHHQIQCIYSKVVYGAHTVIGATATPMCLLYF